jgi:hypothetical protein
MMIHTIDIHHKDITIEGNNAMFSAYSVAPSEESSNLDATRRLMSSLDLSKRNIVNITSSTDIDLETLYSVMVLYSF